MSIDDALNELAKHWYTVTIAQRVVLRRVFAYYGREDLIQ